ETLVQHRGSLAPGQVEVGEVHLDKMHILGRCGAGELRAQAQAKHDNRGRQAIHGSLLRFLEVSVPARRPVQSAVLDPESNWELPDSISNESSNHELDTLTSA